jgi:Calcium-activated chloride channel
LDLRGEPQAVSPYQHFHSSVKALNSTTPSSALAPSSYQQHKQQQQRSQQPHIIKPARFISSSLPDPTIFSAITEDHSFPPKTTTAATSSAARVVTAQQQQQQHQRRPTVTFYPSSVQPLSPSSTSSQSPLHSSSQSMSTRGSSAAAAALHLKSSTLLLQSPRTQLGGGGINMGGGGGTEDTLTIDGEDSLLGERCFPPPEQYSMTNTTTIARMRSTGTSTHEDTTTAGEEESSYMPNSLNEENTEMVAIAYNLHRLQQLERQNTNIPESGSNNNNNNRSRPNTTQTQQPKMESESFSENHRPCGAGSTSFTPCVAAANKSFAQNNSMIWKTKMKGPLIESSSANNNNNPSRSPVNSPGAASLETDAGHAGSKSSAGDDDDGERKNIMNTSLHHQQRMLSMGKRLCMSPGDLSTTSLDTPPPPPASSSSSPSPRPVRSVGKMHRHQSATNKQQHAMMIPESPAGSLASQSQLLGESFVSLMPARSLTPSAGSTRDGDEEEDDDNSSGDDNKNATDGDATSKREGGGTNLCSAVPSSTADKFGGAICNAPTTKDVASSTCQSIRPVQHSLCSTPGPTRDDISYFSPYGSVVSSVQEQQQPKSRRRRASAAGGQSSTDDGRGDLLDSHAKSNRGGNNNNNVPPSSISICSLFRQSPQMPPWRRRIENVQERAASVVVGIGGQLHKVTAVAVTMCRGSGQNVGAQNHSSNTHNLAAGATRAAANLAAVPLSPPRRPNGTRRTHAEQDLNDLTERHRQKVRQLAHRFNDDDQANPTAPLLHDDEYFDFCLVLQPQEAYAFWAGLLDFRVEILGQEAVDALEQACDTIRQADGAVPEVAAGPSDDNDVENSIIHVDDEESGRSRGNSSRFEDEDDSLMSILSPNPRCNIGVYNRRGNSTAKKESSMTPVSCLVPPNHPVSSSKFVAPSPGFYSVATAGCGATLMSIPSAARLSVFERALFANPQTSLEIGDDTLSLQAEAAAAPCTLPFGLNTSAQQQRIKWGNHATLSSTKAKPTIFYNSSQKKNPNLQLLCANTSTLSPPAQSLAQDGSSGIPRPAAGTDTHPKVVSKSSTNRSRDHTVIELESIPNQVIPRGIAARTNGMIPFLNAMTTRGIVVRRHRPGHEALFYRIYSDDRGDTLQYKIVDNHKQAIQAFEEQREKYSKRTLSSMEGENIDPQTDELRASPWSYAATDTVLNKDGAAAGDVVSNALKAIKGGSVRTADIVAIHPSRHQDPRSEEGEKGTSTLRRSKSEYVEDRTFSIVYRSSQSRLRGNTASLDEVENRWYKGEGNDNFFKYVDFEAATEGEYWLLFRGLLLLHRDAAVGRFAEQRAAGIGSHYCRLEGELSDHIDGGEKNRLHRDEFHEPVTVGCMERLLVKLRNQDTTYMKGFTLEGAVPPPSDFFLGFRTPGTAIWSRLRHAGLTTQRLYSLDPRQVVIKVSCPSYRLMDVAEVLRVKLKTLDGSFAPFRQDMIDIFRPVDDPLEHCVASHPSDFQFRSCVRQAIIDFIIRSRIRDSGAELGQATVKRPSGLDNLGKMIQARVPLHMHGKLDAIYNAWFYFWREQNWDGRDGKSLSHEGTASFKGKRTDDISITTGESTDGASAGDDTSSSGGGKIPPLYQRFVVGSLHQPLDSIEEYFGEKVAFYFAWLQHTAVHLVFLSVVGLIVFVCQVSSMTWDHPLRPFFAMVVMIWTFVVLINWRKRANFLAYRWGTMNYKEQEVTRPQFQGEFVKDDITGEDVIRYPQWKRWLKYAISLPVTILFTTGTLIVILWVHANRDVQLARYLEQKTNPGSDSFQFDFAISVIGKPAPIVEMQLSQELFFDPTFWFIVVGMPALLGLFLPLLNFVLMRLSIVSFSRLSGVLQLVSESILTTTCMLRYRLLMTLKTTVLNRNIEPISSSRSSPFDSFATLPHYTTTPLSLWEQSRQLRMAFCE